VKSSEEERDVLGWGAGGPIYAKDHAERHRDSTVRMAMQRIADLQGEVDGLIAQQIETTRTEPRWRP
jgi:hypothetical protein